MCQRSIGRQSKYQRKPHSIITIRWGFLSKHNCGAYADGSGSTINLTGSAFGHMAGVYAQNGAVITVFRQCERFLLRGIFSIQRLGQCKWKFIRQPEHLFLNTVELLQLKGTFQAATMQLKPRQISDGTLRL